ncbi:MAG: HAMP domain-containing sensor histidine kinase [Acidobacteriota bacterium]
MLDAFVAEHREEILRRCRAKVATRAEPTPTPAELAYGVPRFLDQLVDALRDRLLSTSAINDSAALHGHNRHLQGFSVSQVVHDYGDVCQSISDLALQLNAPISVEDFRTLNGCLDDAIASAVTEHGRGNQSQVDAAAARDDERLGFLAHEIRNLVGTASVAFEVLRTGKVGVEGSTGKVLQRSLSALRDLINRSVAEVRLRHDIRDRTRFDIAAFIADLGPAARLDADARGLSFHVLPGDAEVQVDADRAILAATVANLLQNAFKFTRPGTAVTLRASATSERVLIEVEDECGGLPEGNVAGLFQPFEQRGVDRSGLGLGLAISRWGAEANGGRLDARNLPDHGCIFTVDLPRPDRPPFAALVHGDAAITAPPPPPASPPPSSPRPSGAPIRD